MRAVYNKIIKFNYLRGRVQFPTGGCCSGAGGGFVGLLQQPTQ